MNISRRHIFKNISVIMVSQATTWALSLLLTLFLPRYLGVENIGVINLTYSLWAIVSILSTFGMDTYLTREIAKDQDKLNLLFSQSLLVRVGLFFAGTILLYVYSKEVGYRDETLQIIPIIGISTLMSIITGGLIAAIQGLERMEFLAITSIASAIVTTTFSLLAIFFGYGLTAIAWISCLGSAVGLLISGTALSRIYPLRLKLVFEGLKPFLVASFSFFLLYLFINLYQQIDVVVISSLINEKGVGWYSVADRLIGTLMFIPTVFMMVFFPTFSRLHLEAPDQLVGLFRKVFNLMFLMGVAVGFGLALVSSQVINLLYGPEFDRSISILALRGIISVFTYINIIVGMYLISINRQKPWIIVIAAATFATIPLDMILVPLCERVFNNGALGGAFAYLVTEGGMMVAGALLLPKATLSRQNYAYAFRSLIAGTLMILGTRWLVGDTLWLQIILGATLFLVFSVALRLISGEEWLFLKETLSNITGRFRKRIFRPAN